MSPVRGGPEARTPCAWPPVVTRPGDLLGKPSLLTSLAIKPTTLAVRYLPREPPRYVDRAWKGRDSVSHAQVLALVAAVCAAAWLLYRLTRWAGHAGATPGEGVRDAAPAIGSTAIGSTATGPAMTGATMTGTTVAGTTVAGATAVGGAATPRDGGHRPAGAGPLPDVAGDRRRNVSAAARCARLDAGGSTRPATVWRAAEFRLANSRM